MRSNVRSNVKIKERANLFHCVEKFRTSKSDCFNSNEYKSSEYKSNTNRIQIEQIEQIQIEYKSNTNRANTNRTNTNRTRADELEFLGERTITVESTFFDLKRF